MKQSPNLQRRRIQTLWVLDETGDLLTSNEPNPSARQRAPKLHVEWSELGYTQAFRGDVPTSERFVATRIIETRWPFLVADQAPIVEELLGTAGGERRSYSGPVFVATDSVTALGEAVQITTANAELLQGDLFGWQEDIELEQPMFARVVGEKAVSVCATVRRSVVGVEAGVDTLEGHRGQGHGRKVVAAWSAAIQEEGLIAFYSTSWDNAASIGLAKSLGFNQIGASLWVD